MSIATHLTSHATNLDTILSDLNVTKNERGYQVSSSSTRGKCASVIETALGHGGLLVIPLLTKSHMAGIDDAAIRAAVNRYRKIEATGTRHSAATDFLHFRSENSELISRLAEEIGEISEDTHWKLIDEMKASIGSSTAGDAGQGEVVQDVDAWITEHCHTGLIDEDVSIALWLKGQEVGRQFLENESRSMKLVHQRIEEITALANKRKGESAEWFVALHGGAGIAFLNSAELDELSTLKLKLPSSGLQRLQAQSRLAKRIARRKNSRTRVA